MTGEGPVVGRRLELSAIRADGSEFPIELAVARIGAGERPTFVGIVRDITDWRAAEDALREAGTRYRTLVEQLPMIIYVDRLESQAWNLCISPQVERLLGYSPAEWLADPDFFPRVLHPDDRDRVLSSLARAGGTRTPSHIQYRLIAADGRVVWFDDSCAIVHGPGGEELIQGYMLDITEQRLAEDRLLHGQKLESLGVLAGGVAHDFNNLLVAIMGYAGLAMLDAEPASPVQEGLREIELAADRAAGLAREMLAYSGRGRFVVSRLDLSTAVREMTQLLRVSIGKTVSVALRLDAALPPIEADASQLRQVIMNLVVNASEAIGDEAGAITVTTTIRELGDGDPARAWFGADLAAGRYVALEVADTGPGMDGATRTRIFDPFFTTKFTGRGLGLAAVIGIVRGHGGAITVESEPGRGSRFTVLLPALEGLADAPDTIGRGRAGKARSGRALVIDDEPSVRGVTGRMLETMGFGVEAAEDAPRAIEWFEADPAGYDLVLLDLTMPEMAGPEAYRALRAIRPDVRVVVMSGFSEHEVSESFAGEPVRAFIQKPFTAAALESAVDRALAS